MKGILIAIILVLVFALVGWISYSQTDSSATISIDKQEIKEDTQEAARELKEATAKAVDATKDAFNDADEEGARREAPPQNDPLLPEETAP